MTTNPPMPDVNQPPEPPPMPGPGQYDQHPGMPPQQQPKPPVIAMWICLVLAWVFFLLPIPGTIFIAGPLNLAALILAILCLARSSTLHGVLGLIGATVVSVIAYLIGLTLMAVGAAVLAEAGNQLRSQEVRAEVMAATDVLATTDTEMLDAYRNSRSAASSRFDGKIVEVTGVISEASAEYSTYPTLSMYGDGDSGTINLKFYFASKDDLHGAKKGDRVTIRGKCHGSMGDIWIIGSYVKR